MLTGMLSSMDMPIIWEYNLWGAYQPIASLEVGHVFKIGPNNPFILKLNSGITIASYSLNLFNSKNDPETLSETFLQIPLAVSTHIPLMIIQPQSRYHALELKFGGYYGVNIKREIQTYNVPESGSTYFTTPLPTNMGNLAYLQRQVFHLQALMDTVMR